jgi:hypothetical protein
MEGAQDMRRREAGLTGTAPLPAAVEPDPPLTAEAGQEVTARQVGAHHGVRLDSPGQTHMGDLMGHQRLAARRPQDSLPRAGARRVRFNQRRVSHEERWIVCRDRCELNAEKRRVSRAVSPRIGVIPESPWTSVETAERTGSDPHEFSLSGRPDFS